MASRRLFLPLAAPSTPAPRPTVDAMRKRLGGRAPSDPGAGEVVTLLHPGAGRAAALTGDGTGVVLFVRGEQVDVWLPGDVVRRVRRSDTRPADGALDHEVYAVSIAARAFAGLAEGQEVSFEQDGVLRVGTLVEKCRFGALVEVGDASIVGLGFRRVRALEVGEGEP